MTHPEVGGTRMSDLTRAQWLANHLTDTESGLDETLVLQACKNVGGEDPENPDGWNDFASEFAAEYVRLSGRVPQTPPPGTRLILASENLLDSWGTRAENGDRISVEWGEPTPEGWYEPVFTRHSDDNLAARVSRIQQLADFALDDPPERQALALRAISVRARQLLAAYGIVRPVESVR